MTDPLKPVGRIGERRDNERRARERRDQERRAAAAAEAARQALPGNSNLPVPVSAAAAAETKPAAEAAAFAAQLLGQGGHKRGLKGGPPVLEEARSAYLEAEWSGPVDRRKRLGRITKTEI